MIMPTCTLCRSELEHGTPEDHMAWCPYAADIDLDDLDERLGELSHLADSRAGATPVAPTTPTRPPARTSRPELRLKPSGYVHRVAEVWSVNGHTHISFACGIVATGANTTSDFPVRCRRCPLCDSQHQSDLLHAPTAQHLAMTSLHEALGTEPA